LDEGGEGEASLDQTRTVRVVVRSKTQTTIVVLSGQRREGVSAVPASGGLGRELPPDIGAGFAELFVDRLPARATAACGSREVEVLYRLALPDDLALLAVEE
jgi:hypothetical protein